MSHFGDIIEIGFDVGKELFEVLAAAEFLQVIVGRCPIVLRRGAARGGVMHVDYDYCDDGRSLIPVLDVIGNWGVTHDENSG